MTGAAIKALSATERKSLEKIIDGDYDVLKADLRALARTAINDQQEVVREDFSTKAGGVDEASAEYTNLKDAHTDATTELERQFNADKAELLSRWRGKGVISTSDRYADVITFKHEGLDAALNKVSETVNEKLQDTLRVVEKQRVDAQREVLLGGLVSTEARDLLAKIPSAQVLFAATSVGELTAGD